MTPAAASFRTRTLLAIVLVAATLSARSAQADVAPLLQTTWGQGGDYKAATPTKNGAHTYPGCTTIASAQLLYYYQYRDRAVSDVGYSLDYGPLAGPDVAEDGHSLYVDLPQLRADYAAMATDLSGASAAEIDATSTFIYHVGVTLNAQFGGGEGSSATGKQLENAFRYQWGFNNISRRNMSIIAKDAFGYSDAEWAQLIRDELDAGRPVLYMAQQLDADAGHAFVLDGYDDRGFVHVNFGWGGYGNGWYDANVLEDPSGRRWNRDAMIFRGLEPEVGFAAAMLTSQPGAGASAYAWNGAFSLISYASGTATGYGLTVDEARVHPDSDAAPIVFLQWEVDGRDGRRLQISAAGAERASITYGSWNDRSKDRLYRDVALPFILDPSRDGLSTADESYFTIAVAFDQAPTTTVTVEAEPTSSPASPATSTTAAPIEVDGHTWHGNGSLISLASGTRTGYGLTKDEAQIHPGSELDPVVYFQWEIDGRDGRNLELAAEGMTAATIRYGAWSSRGADIERRVSLPYVLDPASDGASVADGEYYVIEVAFAAEPTTDATVSATIVK